MKKLLTALLALSLAHVSLGQLVEFRGILNAEQSGTVSPATGWLSGWVDTDTNWFYLDYAFSDLLAPQTAAHVHRGAPGMNGPVVIGAPTFPLGSPIHFETMISDQVESDLLSGMLYLNVHSQLYPGGEIRGQLMPVPEPSTYALVGVGLLGVVVYLRRRTQQQASS
ncbi:MAG TPA: CHRD domain-containing protein [Acidovorax sp.]|nr:CHRD domain-containing protein [Acidovorax sp.]